MAPHGGAGWEESFLGWLMADRQSLGSQGLALIAQGKAVLLGRLH